MSRNLLYKTDRNLPAVDLIGIIQHEHFDRTTAAIKRRIQADAAGTL